MDRPSVDTDLRNTARKLHQPLPAISIFDSFVLVGCGKVFLQGVLRLASPARSRVYSRKTPRSAYRAGAFS